VIVARRSPSQPTGRVRSARLTDLAAVGELSRQAHSDPSPNASIRTLGIPVGGGHISVFTLFRLPLAALMPGDLLYVYDEGGNVSGLARVEHEPVRDEWTIVELDAVDHGAAGDIRLRLVQRVLKDASKRGGLRFHVACADENDNVELFMQAGFVRYGEENLLYRSIDKPAPAHVTPADAARDGIRHATPLDALELDRLYRTVAPSPVARLEDYRQPDWERQGNHWRVPRSALTPILRFADIEGFVQASATRGDGQLMAFCQIGTSKEEQPHYMRVMSSPGHDPSALIAFGLSALAERMPGRGVLSAVRTYESPIDRRLEDSGFATVATVSLLMKENAERVRQPALVPVASR
jgi:hypothetical protein